MFNAKMNISSDGNQPAKMNNIHIAGLDCLNTCYSGLCIYFLYTC